MATRVVPVAWVHAARLGFPLCSVRVYVVYIIRCLICEDCDSMQVPSEIVK